MSATAGSTRAAIDETSAELPLGSAPVDPGAAAGGGRTAVEGVGCEEPVILAPMTAPPAPLTRRSPTAIAAVSSRRRGRGGGAGSHGVGSHWPGGGGDDHGSTSGPGCGVHGSCVVGPLIAEEDDSCGLADRLQRAAGPARDAFARFGAAAPAASQSARCRHRPRPAAFVSCSVWHHPRESPGGPATECGSATTWRRCARCSRGSEPRSPSAASRRS